MSGLEAATFRSIIGGHSDQLTYFGRTLRGSSSPVAFLELLPEFEDHGIALFQMTRRVPDTLTLNGVSDATVDRVLIQNGLHLRFYLPHAVEFAQLASPHREVLERALQRPDVRELAYGAA